MGLTWFGTGMHAEHFVDDSQKEPSGPQSHKHVQDILMEEFRVHASYRIIERLAVDAMLPVRHTVIDATFEDENGELIPGFTSIHHRSESIFGFADVTISASILAIKPTAEVPFSLTVQIGTTLPTGNTEPDPFKLGAQGLDHQHIFFGTGTVNPTLGLHFGYNFGDFRLASTSHTRLTVMTNAEGYAPSTTIASDLNALVPMPLDGLELVVGTGVFHEWAAEWNGIPARNSGRTDLLATLGVTWDPGEGVNASLLVKLPLLIKAQGGQLEMPVILQAALGGRFNLLD